MSAAVEAKKVYKKVSINVTVIKKVELKSPEENEVESSRVTK